MSLRQRRQTRQKTRSKRLSKEDVEGERLCRRGNRLYQTRLKALLEPDHIGMFAAIEPDSGDYFLGTRMIEAVLKAEEKYPDKLVFIVRIGFPTAVSMKRALVLIQATHSDEGLLGTELFQGCKVELDTDAGLVVFRRKPVPRQRR